MSAVLRLLPPAHAVLGRDGYAVLSLAVIALRGADPEWYRPDFRTPCYPLTQIVGAGGCLILIASSGPYAKRAVVGASRESRLRQVFFGSILGKLADALPCSVLMVRRHLPERWTVRLGESVRSLWERAGLPSSPGQ